MSKALYTICLLQNSFAKSKNKFSYLNILSLLLLVLLSSQNLIALDPTQRISDYKHVVFKHKEGLPQYSIVGITQSYDGYLWFATHEGVTRFDGMQFTIFDKNTTHGINHNTNNTILTTADSTIWLGTVDGLTYVRTNKFHSLTIADGLPHPHITALMEALDGTLFVGTKGGGIAIIKKFKVVDTITTKDGLLSNIVNCLAQGNDSTIFVGGPNGLSYYKNRWHRFNQLGNKVIRALFIDPDGTIWIGTDFGLFQESPKHRKYYTQVNGLPDDKIRSLYRDRDGNLWIGTTNGLARLFNGKISNYTVDDGLSGNWVASIFEDQEGSLWVGTLEGGADQFYSSSIRVLDQRHGLLNEEIRPIYQTRDGSIWVGTNGGGLSQFHPNGSVKNWTTKNGLPSDFIRALCEDSDGGLWVGTAGNGVFRMYRGAFKTWTKKNGLGDDYIYGLIVSRDGSVWIGTREGGLSIIKDGIVQTFTTQDGLPSNTVRTIIQAHDSTMWICTDRGVSHYIKGSFISYTPKDGLSYDVVYSAYEDSDGNLWFGTFSGGINRFKDGKFTACAKKDGLYDNGVFQILEDSFHNLWMTCNRGIYRVRKKDLIDFADGKIQQVSSSAYTEVDGMKNSKCNGSAQPAGIVARDGTLWIPTFNGVALVTPSDMNDTVPFPKVVIEEILYNHQPIKLDSVIVLKPHHNEIEIHFTAITFISLERVQFEYKLDGFNSKWIQAGTRRLAYYTNLPEGRYIFHVRACNRNGVWSNESTAININIEPEFYHTLWFRIIALLASIGLIVGIVEWRTYATRKRGRELQSIVNEKTKNLLEEIKVRQQIEEELQKSRALYFDLVETAQDLIWQCDRDGKFVYLNPAWEKVLGYPLKEMLGKRFTDFQPAQYGERDKKTYEWVLEKNIVQQYETVYNHRNGSSVYLVFNSKYITDESGEVIGTRGTAYDVTERKMVEQQLRESEERYRSLVHFMPVAIVMLREERIIFANPAAFQIFGVSSEVELWGKKLYEFFDQQYRESVRLICQGNPGYTVSNVVEARSTRSDGKEVYVEITAMPMTIQGNPTIQVILHNVTDRKQLMEELMISQKLQGIGTLAGGIAHDFNNILGIIIGYTSRLEAKRNDPQKHREYINAIMKASERGAALVRQILIYARKTSFAMQQIQIRDIVNELFSMLVQTFPRTIQFQNMVSENVPKILADQTQFHQALLNLCVNARDAMPNGGVITIDAKTITKSELQNHFPDVKNDLYLCVSVADTGVGIDEEIKKRIFDPFFSTKEIGQGTGLGLSVVYGIMEAHHGFIDVESLPGKGSTFFLYFPIETDGIQPS